MDHAIYLGRVTATHLHGTEIATTASTRIPLTPFNTYVLELMNRGHFSFSVAHFVERWTFTDE